MTGYSYYYIKKHGGDFDNLVKATSETIPKPKRGQVLVRVHATSLNYRDLMVVKGSYAPSYPPQLVPLSDGAGEVVEIGDDVKEFKIGDRVAGTFFQSWTDGPIQRGAMDDALGGSVNGMLTQYRVFETTQIIKFPSYMSYEEAATLPCAALTAWNALTYNSDSIRPGQSVLVLGTGGVSIFALQFAVAAGATVIATSSSDEKLQRAKELGATHLINYKNSPDWEKKVLELTNGRGVDHVVEVGGAGTLPRSLKSVKAGGHVHMIGVLTQPDDTNIAMAVLFGAANLRGVLVGSRGMFESMNRALEANQIKPLIDKVFDFDQAQEAYEYLHSQKHVGKVVIRIN